MKTPPQIYPYLLLLSREQKRIQAESKLSVRAVRGEISSRSVGQD
jgi:hypothetical protein